MGSIMAGGFKFEPRTLAFNPAQFGKSSESLQPADGIDITDARFMAANLQHRVANAIREGILARASRLESFLATLTPTSPGMSYDRVVRIQRGETLMQLADLLAWVGQFPTVRTVILTELDEATQQVEL